MKIISLQAENIKKLVAIEITPKGNLVQITGKNGSGKTSTLDAIWWAICGAGHIQSTPIRKGAKEGRIRLDLGEIIVTRTFKSKEEGGYTTSITVESAEGARFPSPQKMLDALFGELAFDPLEFTRMKPKEQFDTFKRFVPDVDFENIQRLQDGDFAKRTEVNRQAKEKRGAASLIVLPEDCPTEARNEADLIDQLAKAASHNADIETRTERRKQAAEKIEANKAKAADLMAAGKAGAAAITQAAGLVVEEIKAEIKRLSEKAEATAAKAVADCEDLATATAADIHKLEVETADLQKKLDAAPALPDPVDVDALRQQVDSAKDHNLMVAKNQEKAALIKAALDLEDQSAALTKAMTDREEAKRKAIAEAKLPVDGISFGDNMILLNGLPFDQASDAQQLRVSIAIAMASNPKLRVIRVRDGSLLDEDALKLLEEMANQEDYQVWLEKVASDGKVGFVLEEGRLKTEKPKEEGKLL